MTVSKLKLCVEHAVGCLRWSELGLEIEALSATSAPARLDDGRLDQVKAPKLFLLHIPRTGGTSIEETILGWVGAGQSARHIELLPHAERNSLSARTFLSGHMFYDEMKRLPYISDFKIIIALREPHARLASALTAADALNDPENAPFYSTFDRQTQATADRLATVDVNNATELAEFLATLNAWGRRAFDNCQTRFLSCDPFSGATASDASISAINLRTACNRVEGADFLCITERLTEGIRTVAHALEQPLPERIMQMNSSASPVWGAGRRINHRDPKIREAMGPAVRFDIQLYRHALGLGGRTNSAYCNASRVS